MIAGSSRGRRLPARLPGGVRPTADRVREAIFDILSSLGGVDGATVVDLFCGSGALGAEALSRGASAVTFVDHDPRALAAVRTNLDAAGLGTRSASLVRAELPGWLARAGHVDLALCDPPYAYDSWEPLLDLLDADVAVLESGAPVALPARWMLSSSRRYGGTLVTVVRSTPASSPTPAARPTPAAGHRPRPW